MHLKGQVLFVFYSLYKYLFYPFLLFGLGLKVSACQQTFRGGLFVVPLVYYAFGGRYSFVVWMYVEESLGAGRHQHGVVFLITCWWVGHNVPNYSVIGDLKLHRVWSCNFWPSIYVALSSLLFLSI